MVTEQFERHISIIFRIEKRKPFCMYIYFLTVLCLLLSNCKYSHIAFSYKFKTSYWSLRSIFVILLKLLTKQGIKYDIFIILAKISKYHVKVTCCPRREDICF